MEAVDADIRKHIAARFGGPDITEILKRQNAELMNGIANRLSGPDINEMLFRKQNTRRGLPDLSPLDDGAQRDQPTEPTRIQTESDHFNVSKDDIRESQTFVSEMTAI